MLESISNLMFMIMMKLYKIHLDIVSSNSYIEKPPNGIFNLEYNSYE